MQSTYDGLFAIGGAIILMAWLASFAIGILELVSYWILFTKAGKPGWGCLIPIYNTYLILKIGGRPGWWILLLLIPVVDIIIAIIALASFLKAYGRGSAGSVLLAIFFGAFYFPYLAFSKNVQYVGIPE